MNVAIAALLFLPVRLLDVQAGLNGAASVGAGPFLIQLMWINLALAAFNLLPGYPMDGGRVLRALLAMRMAPERATQTAARVGQVVAVFFGVAGLFGNPFLILIAAFVWLGAQAEHSASTVKIALAGLLVRQGMITDFKALCPTDTLSRAVELTLAGFQQDFPVMEGGRLVGVLTHGEVLRGLAAQGAGLSVRHARGWGAANREPGGGTRRRSGTDAPEQLPRLDGGRDDKVVGLLTVGNIGELMALGAASRHSGAATA